MIDYNNTDDAETEVLIDVSGSVNEHLVKSFLRQLKNLLTATKLKVGFFADGVTPNDKFINIIKEKDIDNISITRLGSGTNFDVAVREFSNNQSINKIIFTDGWPGKMPTEDTKRINVIWLVYENKNFAPCCGKVINVQPKKIIDTQTKAVTQQNININENTR